MRVLFLTLYPETAASPRYRVLQFLPYLRAQGLHCTVKCPMSTAEFARLTGPGRKHWSGRYHLVETPRRLGHLLSARGYDLVFVQKAIMTAYFRGLRCLLHRQAKRLVYDYDDAVHLAPPHPLRSVWKAFEDRAQVVKLMSRVQLVLAGNQWLAAEAEACGARTELMPTVVDTDRFIPAQSEPGAYRIGWIGNPSTTPSLRPLAATLDTLKDAEVCLVGADPKSVPGLAADIRPWSDDGEVKELQRFSVGIMPQSKTDWGRGKCALKALQYMACGIPCIATPFGAVLEFLRDGENGVFADSPEEWRDAFERLRDPALRKRLGQAGRATVEERYSLEWAAPRLHRALESVA